MAPTANLPVRWAAVQRMRERHPFDMVIPARLSVAHATANEVMGMSEHGRSLRRVGVGMAVIGTVIVLAGFALGAGAQGGVLPHLGTAAGPASAGPATGSQGGGLTAALPAGQSPQTNAPAVAAANGKVFVVLNGKLIRYDAATLKIEAIVTVGIIGAPPGGSGSIGGGGGTPPGGTVHP